MNEASAWLKSKKKEEMNRKMQIQIPINHCIKKIENNKNFNKEGIRSKYVAE